MVRAELLDGYMPGNPLDRDAIRSLIEGTEGSPPLLDDFLSIENQLQPNGFDLTLKDISRFSTPGSMGTAESDRELSATESIGADPGGWLRLDPGPYLVTFNEVVNLPPDLMAFGRPRSSLLRSGVSIHSAVWDAGYRGRSQVLLVGYHPLGYRLQIDARLMQLVFFRMDQPTSQGYQGRFQDENL